MTYQQQLESDRQSERTRLAEAMRPNTVQAGVVRGIAGLTVRDKSTRGIMHVTFESHAQVDALIAELQRIRNRLVASTESAPETLRSLPL